MCITCHSCNSFGGNGGLVDVGDGVAVCGCTFCGDCGVLALLMNSKEVMMASHP